MHIINFIIKFILKLKVTLPPPPPPPPAHTKKCEHLPMSNRTVDEGMSRNRSKVLNFSFLTTFTKHGSTITPVPITQAAIKQDIKLN